MKEEWLEIVNRYRERSEAANWFYISKYETLNEDFIREFADKVDWLYISETQILSEDFIREFKDEVDWLYISMRQLLSEDFIREFKDEVDWWSISKYQKLSEDFIREFKDKVNWGYISIYQKLSEDFIREFQDKVNWGYISIYQKLSEEFIREFKDKVYWACISACQLLSKDFIKEFKRELNKDLIKESWHYESTEFKKRMIVDSGCYECYDDYFIAYKSIRQDRYSHYNFQYQYLKGQTYECFADTSDHENSFGLSAWTKEEADKYAEKGLVVRCKIYYKDVARLVHNANKVRCFKIEVLD